MENSQLRLPRRVLFGRGAISATGKAVRELGERALICTDPIIAETPIARQVRDALRAEGISVREYAGTEAELPLSCLDDCVEFASQEPVDVVIGLGGGSSLDIAKGTALLLADPGSIRRFYGENAVTAVVPPIVGIPTTAGTGSEVTPVAVFADPERALKVGVSDPHLVPELAICDPEATLTCPPSVTGFSGVDALVHAVESFCAPVRENPWSAYPGDVFRGAQSLTRHYSLIALEKIAKALERAYTNGDDIEAREEMLFASLCAGIAFGHAGCASAHALQYPVGAATHTPHGLGVALLLPFTLEIARPEADAALVAVAAALSAPETGADRATDAIDEIERITHAVGVPLSLKEIGVTPADLGPFAIDGLGVTRLVRNSPRPMTEDDFVKVLEAAFVGDRALVHV
jgi:alcohol dehydrogenase